MQVRLQSTLHDPRTTDPVAADVNVYALIAGRGRSASRRTLGSMAAGAGIAALAAVLLGIAHWTILTACYLVWSFAVWGLVFGPAHPRSRPWRAVEYLLVVSDTVLAISLAVGLFFLALGPRWML